MLGQLELTDSLLVFPGDTDARLLNSTKESSSNIPRPSSLLRRGNLNSRVLLCLPKLITMFD